MGNFFEDNKLAVNMLSKIIKVNKKIIVFESFLGRQYSDNPKAIYEYIKENHPEYKCYWSIDPKHEDKFKGENLNIIKRFSFEWVKTMLSAKYWVSNSRIPLWVKKPKETIYMQTWHGTPLKKLALDMEKIGSNWKSPELYKKNFTDESKRWDYLVSPNEYSSVIFPRCFGFTNHLLETGYPRNDFLVNGNTNQNIDEIKRKLGIPLDKKVILYAPTWRDKFSFDLPLSLTNLKREFGDDYFILMRLHYLVTRKPEIIGFEDFIMDVSDYNDISDLYLISDILMTDYSSVFFDFAVLNRPMIFYCYDMEIYKDELRGFYFDFENEAPGPIVRTTDELIDVLKNIEQYQVPSEFVGKFTSLEDGNSAQRVSEIMLSNGK